MIDRTTRERERHDERLEACPRCGSEDLSGVLRCGNPELGDPIDDLGEFQVCESCGWERRVDPPEVG